MEKKALFITPHDIYDEFGGGGVKATRKNYELMKEYFKEEGVCLCTFPMKEHTRPPLNAITFKRAQNKWEYLMAALLGCKVYFPWNEQSILRFIEKQNIELLFIDSSMLGRLARRKRNYCTVVFYHNVEADYAMNKVKNESIVYIPSYCASKYNDKCGTEADAVICLNQRDSDRLSELYGRAADFILPITFRDCFEVDRTNCEYKRELLFLGSSFAPNRMSIEWFMRNVMPELNNIHLTIVGKGFECKKEEYEQYRNVKVIGAVEEPDRYYYQHAAVILPIKYGAGMKVKTTEAMMYGRKIFASDEALEGYDVENVPGITRCNEAEEFANAINHYFDKEELKPYEPEVRKLFLEKYETNCIKKEFYCFLDRLLERRFSM